MTLDCKSHKLVNSINCKSKIAAFKFLYTSVLLFSALKIPSIIFLYILQCLLIALENNETFGTYSNKIFGLLADNEAPSCQSLHSDSAPSIVDFGT